MDTYIFENNLNSRPSSYRKIYEFYNSFKERVEQKIFLDLSQITWIDANLCALLDAVIYKLKKECNHKFYLDEKDLSLRFEVFNRNGFLKKKGENLIIDNRATTICLTRFETDDDEKYYEYIGKELFEHRAFKQHPQIVEDLFGHFGEIFANIQLHANTIDPVFACGQYYPKDKCLRFSLVDIGNGIFDPINKFTKGKINSPESAIEWALNGNTIKTDAPGGLGLSKLRNYCDTKGHAFHLISDGIFWGNDCGEFKIWEMEKFPGTFINLGFQVN